jgi:hypothetical protein
MVLVVTLLNLGHERSAVAEVVPTDEVALPLEAVPLEAVAAEALAAEAALVGETAPVGEPGVAGLAMTPFPAPPPSRS